MASTFKNVLFLLGLIGLLYYSWNLLEMNEGFVQGSCKTPDKHVIFMDAQATSVFLLKDPDSYVDNMTPTDLFARGAKTADNYKEKAAKSAATFSEAMKAQYVAAAEDADKHLLRLGHEIIESMQWTFALTKGAAAYEEGLPHTRTHVIFVSTDLDTTHEALVRTLVHEKLHLFQRAYPEKIAHLLDSAGYTRWKYRVGEPRVRANPDLDPWIYIDPDTKKPMIAKYTSDQPKSIGYIDVSPQDEHPFERMAYELVQKIKVV